jgi:hypothetical protein
MHARTYRGTIGATCVAVRDRYERNPNTVAAAIKIPNGEAFPERELEIIIMHESGG